MIRPLRISVPWDSQPFSGARFGAAAIVRNTATGLNIPAMTEIAASPTAYYQSADWIMCQGFDFFSLLAYVGPYAGATGMQIMAVPVSATDPTRQLDGITWGEMVTGGYVRVSCERPNVFGFYLRFIVPGGVGGLIYEVLELEMCKR